MAITDKLALWKQRKTTLVNRRNALNAKYALLETERKQLEADEAAFQSLEDAIAAELAAV